MIMTPAEKKWKAENTVLLAVRLQKSTDADLVAWMEEHGGSSKAAEIKRLMRIAIAAEQNKQ